MRVSLIVAVAENGVIGRDNDLIWKLRDDMQFFASTTRGHSIITGRKNYESIPERFRPLKDRLNIVVTRNKDYQAPGALVVHSLHAALEAAKNTGDSEVFIIGGGQIYQEVLTGSEVDRQFITHVQASPSGDTEFDLHQLEEGWQCRKLMEYCVDARNEFAFSVCQYDRIKTKSA
jgi:dihydrofolate reductase